MTPSTLFLLPLPLWVNQFIVITTLAQNGKNKRCAVFAELVVFFPAKTEWKDNERWWFEGEDRFVRAKAAASWSEPRNATKEGAPVPADRDCYQVYLQMFVIMMTSNKVVVSKMISLINNLENRLEEVMKTASTWLSMCLSGRTWVYHCINTMSMIGMEINMTRRIVR